MLISILLAWGFSVAKSQLPEDIIISQPQSIVKCYDTQDEYLDLLVNVNTNLYDYYVQWYKENNKIGNLQKNETRLIFPSLNYSHSAKYIAEVIVVDKGSDPILNPLKSQFTNEVLVYVLAQTEIIRHPKTVELVKTGDKVEFSFEAHTKGIIGSKNDSEVKIEWFKGNRKLVEDDRITGTKSSVLTIKKIQQSDFGLDYRVVVTAECGTDTSDYFGIVEVPRIIDYGWGFFEKKCYTSDRKMRFMIMTMITDGSELERQWYFNDIPLVDGNDVTGSKTDTLYFNVKTNGNLKYVVKSLKHGIQETFDTYNAKLNNRIDTNSNVNYIMMYWYVDEGPIIFRQPQSVKVKDGEYFELSTVADNLYGTYYEWYKDGNKVSTSSSKIFYKNNAKKEDEGKYYCLAINSCTSTSTDTVTVEVEESAIYMSLEETNSISIFPNPSSDKILVDLQGYELVDLVIYDVLGNEIMSIRNYTNKSEINISNLSIGTYTIQIQTNTGSISRRLLVNR